MPSRTSTWTTILRLLRRMGRRLVQNDCIGRTRNDYPVRLGFNILDYFLRATGSVPTSVDHPKSLHNREDSDRNWTERGACVVMADASSAIRRCGAFFDLPFFPMRKMPAFRGLDMALRTVGPWHPASHLSTWGPRPCTGVPGTFRGARSMESDVNPPYRQPLYMLPRLIHGCDDGFLA